MMEPEVPLRVLELYSGIGGMHYALKESCIAAKVVAAVDINTVANEVYKRNFPYTYLCAKTIEGMTLDEFNKLDFDMILMSPPCQPFTSRVGSQKDVLDPRTKSFLYILDILPRLSKTPKYILLENVKGFETSVARDKLIQTLESCRYTYQAFLLSPTLLGIPNSRLRYFLLAKLQPDTFCFQIYHQILKHFPDHDDTDLKSTDGSRLNQILSTEGNKKEQISSEYCAENGKSQANVNLLYKLETPEHQKQKQIQNNNLSIQMIQDFLEEGLQDPSPYFIPPKLLLRYALILDIVGRTCRRSVCFTKGYGHYVEGTGSVLKTASDVELSVVFQSFDALSEDEKLTQLSKLKLRYFTPREIANLHGFPPEFSFPEKISLRQSYRLLGNSLNIHVVAKLIQLMVE
ncbi:tRNA (cytosine(38)-C(5))-methyltransferase isoform X1 [Carcharodon carcharias]|uniref:tRNA (cytosine(38)-C(5))-methyltransferase isoform X1 n=1 Tax=Carcharodon carcharias TaxID=13397 RepID=UPI001B7F5A7C|nr:tRNA (cytosine(38)-C(5))-methyltransferase isoform X1 [Carcharodon carcharias]